MGGSNGGLLMGVEFTQRPDLYNAVVCLVPLLDMQRYNKLLAGASWMAEYGNPDVPEEWAYISKYSPYQNVRADGKYPKVFFYTSTADDRVHPGHATKDGRPDGADGPPVLLLREHGRGPRRRGDQQAAGPADGPELQLSLDAAQVTKRSRRMSRVHSSIPESSHGCFSAPRVSRRPRPRSRRSPFAGRFPGTTSSRGPPPGMRRTTSDTSTDSKICV